MPKALSKQALGEFRERVCDVAERLFAQRGPEGVTMRELASALGVSSMTPYRYFQDKDAILAAVRARAFLRFAAVMEEAAGRIEREGWAQTALAYLRFARDQPAAYLLMFDTAQPTADRYPELVAAIERARATMGARLIGARMRDAASRDPQIWAHAIWSVLHGAVMLELNGKLHGKLTAKAIALPALGAIAKELGISVEGTNGKAAKG